MNATRIPGLGKGYKRRTKYPKVTVAQAYNHMLQSELTDSNKRFVCWSGLVLADSLHSSFVAGIQQDTGTILANAVL